MSSDKNMSALFYEDGDDDGELFRDKVRALLEHFDSDQDGYLSFPELGALQKATSGELLTEEMYIMACRALDCIPQKGISLDALKLTYAAEGSDIEKDYYMVFPERDPNNQRRESKAVDTSENPEDKVYEVGPDGTIDVS